MPSWNSRPGATPSPPMVSTLPSRATRRSHEPWHSRCSSAGPGIPQAIRCRHIPFPSDRRPMTPREPTVKSVWLPEQSIIGKIYKHVDLSDAYAISLPAGTSHDPQVLARFVFSRRARWMDALMGVRDAVVSVFGLKTSAKLGLAD
ncbi:MAG: DUF2867 domain-containing protein, partial [Lysobacteraceae bacterium]